MNDAKVNQALALLMSVKSNELTVKEAVEIIELVTNIPESVREILRIAEAKGLIKRDGGRIIIKSSPPIEDFSFPKPKIKKTRCRDNCKRCGRHIGNCHYILLDDTIIGPLGSECIKKLKLSIS